MNFFIQFININMNSGKTHIWNDTRNFNSFKDAAYEAESFIIDYEKRNPFYKAFFKICKLS